jgi:thioredoxin-related protein
MKAIRLLFLVLSLSLIACNASNKENNKPDFLMAFFDNCGIKPVEDGYYLVLQNTGCLKCIQHAIDSFHRFEQLPAFQVITDGNVKIPEINAPVVTVKTSTIRNANLELYTSTLLMVNNDTITKKYTLDYDLDAIFELLP